MAATLLRLLVVLALSVQLALGAGGHGHGAFGYGMPGGGTFGGGTFGDGAFGNGGATDLRAELIAHGALCLAAGDAAPAAPTAPGQDCCWSCFAAPPLLPSASGLPVRAARTRDRAARSLPPADPPARRRLCLSDAVPQAPPRSAA